MSHVVDVPHQTINLIERNQSKYKIARISFSLSVHVNIIWIIHAYLKISYNETKIVTKLVGFRFQNTQDIECVLIIPHVVIEKELGKVFVNCLEFEAVDAP